MNFTEFKNELNSGKEYFAYLLEGEDAYFKQCALALIKEQFLSEPALNLANLDGDDLDFNELLASIGSMPFMSRKRVTVVKGLNLSANALSSLKETLKNPNPDSVLVIVNDKPIEQLKNLDSVCHVSCKKADTQTLVKWIKARLAKEERFIDGETAKTLAEFCLSDMSRIENETLKLIDATEKGGTVTLDDVRENVYKDADYKIYQMTDFIAQKKYDKAYSVVTDLLSRSETPHRILFSIYSFYRRLFLSAISNKTAKELMALFSIGEYPAIKTLELSKKFKKISLKKAVDLLTDADYKIKSGLLDADEGMWISIFKLMNE